MDELSAALAKTKGPDDIRADVEIYLKAAQWITRHPEEFYKPEYNDQLLAVLDPGCREQRSYKAASLHGRSRRGVFPAPIDLAWMGVCSRTAW